MNTILTQRVLHTSQTIQMVKGDLTEETTGAIVNAANARLQHGAGVAGAIRRRAGSLIQLESDAWIRKHGPVTHENPAWTSGGMLPAKHIIHAVGPVWGDGDEDAKLTTAIHGALRLADEHKLDSVSFPAISTGVFGFPKDRAAKVMLESISSYFSENESGIKLVRLVLFDDPTIEAFTAAWESATPP